MQFIPQDGGAGLSNLAGLLKGGAPTGLLSGIFGGPGLGAAGRTLDQALGFKASSLIGLAAPVVMGLISRMRSEQKLDAVGIGKVLQDEQQSFFAAGGENATLVKTVLDASNEANTTRASYTDAQWLGIRLGPMAAAQVVMHASPSGPIGTIKEAGAVARAVDEVRTTAVPASLLGVAFDENFTMEELNSLGGRKASKEQLLETIKNAVATVASHSATDAIAYRRFLTEVAMKVAEASKEGGFLGVGGTLVSAEEQVALQEVDRRPASSVSGSPHPRFPRLRVLGQHPVHDAGHIAVSGLVDTIDRHGAEQPVGVALVRPGPVDADDLCLALARPHIGHGEPGIAEGGSAMIEREGRARHQRGDWLPTDGGELP